MWTKLVQPSKNINTICAHITTKLKKILFSIENKIKTNIYFCIASWIKLLTSLRVFYVCQVFNVKLYSLNYWSFENSLNAATSWSNILKNFFCVPVLLKKSSTHSLQKYGNNENHLKVKFCWNDSLLSTIM